MSEQKEAWETPKSRGRRGNKRQPPARNDAEGKYLQDARSTRIVEGLTVDKLLNEFIAMEKRFGNTECARQVAAILRKRDWSISEAICIGTGSFSVDWEHRYRSLWQLVLFMTVLGLVAPDRAKIKVYAQEPAYNSLDASFLSTLGINVLSDDAQDHISPSSFIFAPFVDWYILLPAFIRTRDPQLYVGNEILIDYTPYTNWDEKTSLLKECNDIGKTFLEGREKKRVPQFELHAHALNGLMVYLKDETEED